jgi:carboxymethylenebutenolidase
MSALLDPLPVTYSHVVHENAEHGYALPDRDIYDSQAAAGDWERIFPMWRRVLGEG